jgi:taurine dioxygenase
MQAPRYTSGMGLEVRKIAGALGAEVHGVDLSQPLADAQKAELRRAWLEHLVLFFRDQPLAPEQFMAFARAWGEPIEYPFVKGIEGFPQIIEVKKLEHEKVNFGGIWHSDTTYLDVPPMASMLACARGAARRRRHAVREPVPRVGSAVRWHEANPGEARRREPVGEGGRFQDARGPDQVRRARRRAARIRRRASGCAHPPGDRPQGALCECRAHRPVQGNDHEESAPLLEFLFRHQVRPEFTCRFTWQTGSIALWDNRCAQHNPGQRLPRLPPLDAPDHACGRAGRARIPPFLSLPFRIPDP